MTCYHFRDRKASNQLDPCTLFSSETWLTLRLFSPKKRTTLFLQIHVLTMKAMFMNSRSIGGSFQGIGVTCLCRIVREVHIKANPCRADANPKEQLPHDVRHQRDAKG